MGKFATTASQRKYIYTYGSLQWIYLIIDKYLCGLEPTECDLPIGGIDANLTKNKQETENFYNAVEYTRKPFGEKRDDN